MRRFQTGLTGYYGPIEKGEWKRNSGREIMKAEL